MFFISLTILPSIEPFPILIGVFHRSHCVALQLQERMRINRGKAIRKYLRFYRIVFGLEDPFHVILDGNFIFNAMKYQVDIFDRFKTQMQGAELNFYMTKSAMLELQKVKGDVGKQSVEWAEKFCNGINDDEYTSIGKGETPAEKLISFLQHRHHEWVRNPVMNETERNSKEQRKYFVATQDKTLRQSLAGIPGIPLVYLNSVAFVMEPPSEKSKTFNAEVEKSKINAISASEAKVVDVREYVGVTCRCVEGISLSYCCHIPLLLVH